MKELSNTVPTAKDDQPAEWVTIPVMTKNTTPDPTEEDGYYDGCDDDTEIDG